MIKRTLEQIQNMVMGHGLKAKDKNISINGVSIDTRTIKKNQLFIPIKGERFNGHKFIQSAIDNGAIASLWCESEPKPDVDIPLIFVKNTVDAIQRLSKKYRNQLSTKIIGITGSNGKTSTKDILSSILKTKYKTHKTYDNLNNHLGVPLTLLSMDEDTEMAVIEMGMSSLGEIEVLTNIATPDAAIITNIGEAHLQDLKSKENIIKAKLEIVKGLKRDGLFVYNGDDPRLSSAVDQLNLKQKTRTFGENSSNDYVLKAISIDYKGLSFEIPSQMSPTLFLPMLGSHQIYNATAAIAVAKHFGISFGSIKEGLKNVNLTKMRSELIHGDGFDILNDSYNANPPSTKAALDTIYPLNNYKQKIVVFGDMLELGDQEIHMHEEIGDIIDLDKIDYFFTIGTLAKYAAKKAQTKTDKNIILSFTNKNKLVESIKDVLKDNSLILLKGSRGLALEEVAEALLNKKN